MWSEAHTPPSLPAHDPAPPVRSAALARAREAYQYDFGYGEQCFVRKLPIAEYFSPAYLVNVGKIAAELAANRAAATVGGWGAREDDALEPYHRMFPVLRSPRALEHWKEDWCFGWQRLAGPCPVVLQRLEALPAYLPIGDAHIERALGRSGVGVAAGVAAALAEGRLYVADYATFAGLRGGTTDGREKHVWTPVAVFVAHPGGLAPVVIQIDGHAGTATTLVGPWEGARWMLARTVVQAMDENHQAVITHLGTCHMVIQRFVLAARRQLAPWHPLLRLLAPHFENTLAVNQVVRRSVVSPGGSQDRLLAPVLEDQLALLARRMTEIDLASLDPRVELARRGVHDPECLPMYPFRDDSLPLFQATHDFVAEYVALYYPTDGDVATDGELAAFVAEIGAEDGGRLPRMMAGVRVATAADVTDLVARVLFRATTFHAAINDANYDWASFAPNMPNAAFAPFPPPGAPIPEGAHAEMLPSVSLCWESIGATYQVAEIGRNRLGRYPDGHFGDGRVTPIVTRFQERGRARAATPRAPHARRPSPYEYLLPSRVTASINA
jgi:arachidonate 15-lipoxygenase